MRDQDKEGLLNITILAVSLLAFVCSFHQSIEELQSWYKFSWFYYILVTGMMSAVTCWIVNKQENINFRNLLPWFLFLIAVLAPSLILRLTYISELSIWIDEYVQVANRTSPFIESAIQQQPPFVYQLTTGMVELFGFTEFWLRVSSVVFGTMVIFAGGLLGLILRWSKWVNIIWMILLGVTPVLVRYSFEGRPNIAGVFVCLLWMTAVAWTVFKEKPNRFDFFRVLATTFLFCITIGMQSLALPLYSMPILLLHQWHCRKSHWKLSVVPQILALLTFAPILFVIFLESLERNQFQAPESWFDRFFNFSEFHWIDHGLQVFEMIPHFKLIIVAMILCLSWMWLKKRDGRQNLFEHLILLLVLALPFVYGFIFQVTINWDFFARYLICYVVVFIGYFMHLCSRARVFVKLPSFPRQEWSGSLLVFVLTGLLSWHVKANLDVTNIYSYGSDIRVVYKAINQRLKQQNLIAMYTVDMNAPWEPRSMLAPEFYLSHIDGMILNYRHYGLQSSVEGDQVSYIVNELFSSNYDSVFLIMGPFRLLNNQHFFSPSEIDSVNLKVFDGYQLIQLTKDSQGEPVYQTMIEFFETWKQSDDKWADSFKICEILYYLYAYSGDIEKASEKYSWLVDYNEGPKRLLDHKKKILRLKQERLLKGLSLVE